MELVYLWVGKYKNIENQGFNFSPRFECEYDGENLKVCDKKKNECKNNEYLENFFGENINVTAIVGKNGTGKSSIVKLLYSLYNNSLARDVNCFAIFYDHGQNKRLYLGNVKKFRCLKNYTELRNTVFVLFDYSLTYNPDFNYNKDRLIYPKKQINSIKGVISLTQELLSNQKNILLNYFELEKNNQLDKFKDFLVPKELVVEWNNARFQNNIKTQKPSVNLLDESRKKIETIISNIPVGQTLKKFIGNLKDIQNILNDQQSYKQKKEFDFDNPFFPNWFKWCESFEENNQINNVWNNQFNNIHWNTFTENIKISPQKLYKEIVEDGESNVPSYEVLSYQVKNLNKELIEIILTSFGQEYFKIKLIDENEKVLNDLSFGEQQLIFILNQLFALKYDQPNGEDCEIVNFPNYVVLLDEIDVGFHPDWQKRAVNYICDFLKLIPEKNFHLVFTTHSPFILSDIPKENVIFLEKYKENNEEVKKGIQKSGNCKNVSKEIELKTFGANIHTLLSDGFFMSDGLMGEFAKSKIGEIKKFYELIQKLQNKGKIKKEIWKKSYLRRKTRFGNIQKIIGEPFLQTIIKNYLDELEILFNGKNQFLDNEIKRLQSLKDD